MENQSCAVPRGRGISHGHSSHRQKHGTPPKPLTALNVARHSCQAETRAEDTSQQYIQNTANIHVAALSELGKQVDGKIIDLDKLAVDRSRLALPKEGEPERFDAAESPQATQDGIGHQLHSQSGLAAETIGASTPMDKYTVDLQQVGSWLPPIEPHYTALDMD